MNRNRDGLDEYVMVFPSSLLYEAGYFNGVSFDVAKYLDVILDSGSCEFMHRRRAERDPGYKQVIPYVIFRHGDAVFSYRRGRLMTEKRLHGSYSIGIGGHISVLDPGLFGTHYDEGMQREVNEEVAVGSPYTDRRVALINDDSNDVGRVHFGVVHVFSLDKPLVKPKEKSINEARFIPAELLHERIEHYETWSQRCIAVLDRIFSAC